MRLLHTIKKLLGFRRVSRPEDIPTLLDAETLNRAMQEARNLKQLHNVDVNPVSSGELPIPRRADTEER